MKGHQNSDDPWQYATYEGAERMQHQQTAKMTFSERLHALENMIRLARRLHINPSTVKPPELTKPPNDN